MKKNIFILLVLLLSKAVVFSQPKYEFRGVWIATVNNIDWPAANDTNTEKQKADYIRLLELHSKNGMNAMVVQVRPSADAFYPSDLEPWSQWLTGTQGKAPSPFYDPLQFMIEETHKRGMEFHAWLNPYRAVQHTTSSSVAPNHITRVHPGWFVTYGDKKYFNPGNKEAQQFVVRVVRDIVKRYEVDAIHMDDYFYPYRIPGKEFPDEAAYRSSGSVLKKEDWRRSNVDSIIRALSIAIKEEKKMCRFGISPFAVWRNLKDDPQGSDSNAGQTNYDDLYADVLLWMKKGWIDYVVPQLYRAIADDKMAYEKMLDWWSRHSYGRHVYIGHGIYRGVTRESPGWERKTELPDQIKLLRRYPTIQGSVFFSSNSFEKNPGGWNDSLQQTYYRHQALLPPMRWIDNEKPWPPIVERKILNDSIIHLTVKPDPRNRVDIKYFVVYQFAPDSHNETFGNQPQFLTKIVTKPGGFSLQEALSSRHFSYRYVITAIGKNNNESELSEIAILVQPDGRWQFYMP